MANAKPGERFRCESCGTEVVIIRTEVAVPRCCGADMENKSAKPAAAKPAQAG